MVSTGPAPLIWPGPFVLVGNQWQSPFPAVAVPVAVPATTRPRFKPPEASYCLTPSSHLGQAQWKPPIVLALARGSVECTAASPR